MAAVEGRDQIVERVYPRLEMVVVEFELEAEQRVSLPRYTGATIRGALGRALRANVCSTGFETCDGCPVLSTCPYSKAWEANLDVEGAPGRMQQLPRPYVLEPIDYGRKTTFDRGERLAFRLKLLGDARNQVPHFILAARDMGRFGLGRGRSKCRLREVRSFDEDGRPITLFEEGRVQRWATLGTTLVDPEPTSLDRALMDEVKRVTLSFETPLQLTHRGKPLTRFDAETLTARLTERLDALALVHQGLSTTWDFRSLRAESRDVRVVHADVAIESFERYSQRSQARVPMRGILGNVVLTGVTPNLWALWRAGRHVHVGKQATFGFGRIRLDLQ